MEAYEDRRLTLLVSRLSLNSVQLDDIIGGGAGRGIDNVMFNAAAAMRNKKLLPQAYVIGRALYADDQAYQFRLGWIGVGMIDSIARQHSWPSPDPTMFDDWLQSQPHVVVESLRDPSYNANFNHLLAALAYHEITKGSICKTCNGTGVSDSRPCRAKSCHAGRRPMTQADRAAFVKMEYNQWYTHWRIRYEKHVLAQYKTCLNQFEQHLLEVCR